MVQVLMKQGLSMAKTILLIFGVLVAALTVQADDLRRQVANLSQDVEALRSVVGKLRIEMEDLERQNRALMERLQRAEANRSQQADIMRLVDARLESMRAEMKKAESDNRREIIQTVTRQMDALAKQVQESLQRVAAAGGSRPAPVQSTPTFSDDYPRTGINYLVKPGDTLSGIASRNNSRTSWIRDANKIVDPSRDLLAGQTIFVPQED